MQLIKFLLRFTLIFIFTIPLSAAPEDKAQGREKKKESLGPPFLALGIAPPADPPSFSPALDFPQPPPPPPFFSATSSASVGLSLFFASSLREFIARIPSFFRNTYVARLLLIPDGFYEELLNQDADDSAFLALELTRELAVDLLIQSTEPRVQAMLSLEMLSFIADEEALRQLKNEDLAGALRAFAQNYYEDNNTLADPRLITWYLRFMYLEKKSRPQYIAYNARDEGLFVKKHTGGTLLALAYLRNQELHIYGELRKQENHLVEYVVQPAPLRHKTAKVLRLFYTTSDFFQRRWVRDHFRVLRPLGLHGAELRRPIVQNNLEMKRRFGQAMTLRETIFYENTALLFGERLQSWVDTHTGNRRRFALLVSLRLLHGVGLAAAYGSRFWEQQAIRYAMRDKGIDQELLKKVRDTHARNLAHLREQYPSWELNEDLFARLFRVDGSSGSSGPLPYAIERRLQLFFEDFGDELARILQKNIKDYPWDESGRTQETFYLCAYERALTEAMQLKHFQAFLTELSGGEVSAELSWGQALKHLQKLRDSPVIAMMRNLILYELR